MYGCEHWTFFYSRSWGQRGIIPGMKPCSLNCPTCPFIEPGTVIQSFNTSKKIDINGNFNCKTRNVVYCITCEQCKLDI